MQDFLSGGLRLVQGYPEVSWTEIEPGLTQRHLTVNGCPATLVERPIVVSGIPCRYILLLVYRPEHAFIYSVGGIAEAGNAGWFENEMQAIISSFHVEKVAPAAGRR